MFAGSTAAGQDVPGANCWPLAGYTDTRGGIDREFATVSRPGAIAELTVTSPDGAVLYTQSASNPLSPSANLLHFPAPLTAQAYALVDHPRFTVPPWGPTPIPQGAKVDPALVATNGYDFRNNVNGDTYVFLLGGTLDEWHAARRVLIALTGPTPLLPDFAWGTWFTWWTAYTEAEAKSDIAHWENGSLPIDVWALDMNWRNTSHNQDHFYRYPDTALFKNFTEWFEFLESKKLRTYFNDHPFPVANQTSPKEVAFRWNGLTEWMERGLTYWWFDRNWGFSIPPPGIPPVGGWNQSHTGGDWEGLDNAAWGRQGGVSGWERRGITRRRLDPPLPPWQRHKLSPNADILPCRLHRFPLAET